MSTEIIKQGAEAKLFLGEFNGQKCLIKERFQKKYRHPDLDQQLTKERMRAESKALSRCTTAGILTPKVLHMDLNERKIYMEYLDKSITAKLYINEIVPSIDDADKRESKLNELAKRIGNVVGRMHLNNIIHGDLTTSNILLNPTSDDLSTYDLIMIDFGLANYGQSGEQKGVDLYVLERALLSTHSGVPTLFNVILDAYKDANAKNWTGIIQKFEEIRARGRKRTMVG